MSDELAKAKARIAQLENDFKTKLFMLPPEPCTKLADDEWYATFNDFQDLSFGTISKYPAGALTGRNSNFKVKRVW